MKPDPFDLRPTYRSISQANEYDECPYRYKLKRIDGVWQKPAAWLPQGTAVHSAIEHYELSERRLTLEEMQDIFRNSYVNEVNRLCKQTPNFKFWFSSGPYKGEQDLKRRYHLGMDQVRNYYEYVDERPEEVWRTPLDRLAIELPFSVELGGVEVRGVIDQIIEHQEDDELVIVDVKTGRKPPESDFQLGVGALAVNLSYGTNIDKGTFWLARSGKATVPYNLSEWSKDRITDKFVELDRKIRNEEFDADPDPDKCKFCPVSLSCPFFAQ